MTEDPYYTYNPEEETTPRRNNSKLFTGLIIGLLIGGVVGYALGSQNLGGLAAMDTGSASFPFVSINIAIIFALFVFLLVARLKRSGTANYYQGDLVTKKIIILLVGLMALLAAGIFVFFAS